MRQLLHRGCAPLEQWFRLQGVPPAISSGSRDQPRRPDETPADTPHNLELDPKVIPDSERSAAPESSSRAYGLHRSDEMAVDTTDDGKDDTPTSSDDQLVMVLFFSLLLERREVHPDQRFRRPSAPTVGCRARGKERNGNVDPQKWVSFEAAFQPLSTTDRLLVTEPL